MTGPGFRDGASGWQQFVVHRRMLIPAVRIRHHDVAIVFNFMRLYSRRACGSIRRGPPRTRSGNSRDRPRPLIRLRVAHTNHRVMIFNHRLSKIPQLYRLTRFSRL